MSKNNPSGISRSGRRSANATISLTGDAERRAHATRTRTTGQKLTPPSGLTEFAFNNLGKAFKNFFTKRAEYPKFKRKGKNDSFTINASGRPINIGGKRIKLPTIGWVDTSEVLPHTTTTTFTISKKAGVGEISFSYEIQPEITKKQYDYVGVDLGIKTLATLSTGVIFINPKAFRGAQKKLTRLQRQLSRKVRGSNRYQKQKLRISKLHRRIRNIRGCCNS